MSITNRKERTDETPRLNNSTQGEDCQEKTLVANNAIFENMNKFTVYSHCVVFKKRNRYASRFPPERKKRGAIKHFSKRARFRLFEFLAKIDNNLKIQPLFVSLTYHHGHQNSNLKTKNQLHNFLVQLRNFDPDVQFIWRFEYQKRGAPHYHLIIFPGPTEHYQNETSYSITISKIWHFVADPTSRKHVEYGCKVVTIHSYREACCYLSKYIAKENIELADHNEGKFYGNSRNLPIKIHKIVGHFDEESAVLIKKLFNWMKENGRGKYADERYMNICSDFTVFIDKSDFLEMVDFNEYFFRDS